MFFMEYINSQEGRYARLAYFDSYGPITLEQARSFMRLRLGQQADEIERLLSEIEAVKGRAAANLLIGACMGI